VLYKMPAIHASNGGQQDDIEVLITGYGVSRLNVGKAANWEKGKGTDAKSTSFIKALYGVFSKSSLAINKGFT
jgi:hypothetical protein